MSWRDAARPIIAEVIAKVGRDDEKKLRSALREAYPFGPKQYHPYKMWLDEIKRQLKPVANYERASVVPENIKPLEGQKELF